MAAGFFSFLGAAFGGGLTVKVLDIIYAELRRRSDQTTTVTKFVDTHLDPLLKAADELGAKLYSLGKQDFHSLRVLDDETDVQQNTDLGGLLFLFAQFWSRIEIFRLEGLALAISRDERGHELKEFLACLESTSVRLVNRTSQRAIAETILDSLRPPIHAIRYIDFAQRASKDVKVKQWLAPLKALVVRGWHTGHKQKMLQYAAVLHAMIDTLDPDHTVTGERPGIFKKFSKRTRQHLKHQVFGVYLRFVKDRQKYIGPSKIEGPIVVTM